MPAKTSVTWGALCSPNWGKFKARPVNVLPSDLGRREATCAYQEDCLGTALAPVVHVPSLGAHISHDIVPTIHCESKDHQKFLCFSFFPLCF